MTRLEMYLGNGAEPILLDIGEETILLRFRGASSDFAEWEVPSYPGELSSADLTELRAVDGKLHVIVEGPRGFRAGPFTADRVRTGYPPGEYCYIYEEMPDGKLSGMTVGLNDGEILVRREDAGPEPAAG